MKRNPKILTLPFSPNEIIEHPENTILEFGEKGTIDIGSLCYLQRDNKFQRAKKYHSKPVIQSSFNEKRSKHIKKLITLINNLILSGETSIISACELIRIGLIPYINWADDQGLHDSFYEELPTRKALKKYNQHIHQEQLKSTIKSSTAARKIQNTLRILNLYLDRDDMQDGIIVPRKVLKDLTATEPVEEHTQAQYLSLCKSIFDGFSQLILNGIDFPYALRVPGYLSIRDDTLWIFPIRPWFKHDRHKIQNTKERELFAYNFQEGRLKTFDELALTMSRDQARSRTKTAIDKLIASNSNKRHPTRLRLAEVAHNAFVQMFLANTGMNFTQAKKLLWTNDYVTGVERQGFRALKWRAAGKLQSFEIQSSFLTDFKIFLELRKYILNNSKGTSLFILHCADHCQTIKPTSSSAIRNLHDFLIRIDEDLPRITPRQWRASKSDWMLRNNVSTKVAATILQNSEKSIIKSYSAGSQITHYQEMSSFLEHVSKTVRAANDRTEDSISTPSGSCSNIGVPRPIRDVPPLATPDCQSPEGCLFCDQYHVHADERDVRKLISIKYCINQLNQMSSSAEHFERTFGALISRINEIICQIETHTNDINLVSRVRHFVEVHGELDSYWEQKLDLLINLGLID